MPRTKQCRLIERPEDSPDLELVWEDTEDKPPDAVIILPEEGLLKHAGKYYQLEEDFDDDWVINEVFLYQLGDKCQMILQYDGNCEMKCDQTVLPDAEQKLKLTKVFQEFGSKLEVAAQQIADAAKGIKAMYTSMNAGVEGVCAGFDIKKFDRQLERKYALDPRMNHNARRLMDIEDDALAIVAGAKGLVNADPFSRKRKAPEKGGE